MVLSVIIVNYNVRFFLEQNLHSVLNAARDIECEVIVIDNHSTDNSIGYLRPLFPAVRFICNDHNPGFGKACNQGLAIATGEFVLFLNPDTIVGEDTFTGCLAFFHNHPDAGALGVKMLDGRGRFLPESKRAFPSPLTSFYKLTGLARLFPRSPVFSRYHLRHLDRNHDHRVEVLSGAYLMARKKVLDLTGGFDEQFFMYGEDIDLSFRIRQAGYQNYYFAGAPIIHFKGESTRKGSANYVRMFYQAMSIFVRKHYGRSRAGIFNASIQLAIAMRGILSAAGGFIKNAGMPLIDATLIVLCFTAVKAGWNEWVRPSTGYDTLLVSASFAILTVLYLIIAYYAGLYDRTYKNENLRKTATVAILVVLSVYSLLPEHLRFSRAIILIGSVFSFASLSLVRRLLVNAGVLVAAPQPANGLIIVMGSEEESAEVRSLLGPDPGMNMVTLPASTTDQQREVSWAGLTSMMQAGSSRGGELIYCAGHLPVRELIANMAGLAPLKLRIHYNGSGSVVGSESANRSGNAYSANDRYRIGRPFYRRWKRLVDVLFSFTSLVTFPLHLVLVRKPAAFLKKSIGVLTGQLTWVGYGSEATGLPPLRPSVLAADGSVLPPAHAIPETMKPPTDGNMNPAAIITAAATVPGHPPQVAAALDLSYAETYTPAMDVRLLFNRYRSLGN